MNRTFLIVLCLLLPTLALAQDATEEPMMDDMGMTMADVGTAYCDEPTALPETVTVGAIFGLSGSTAIYGQPQQQAVQLAVDEINEANYLGDGTTLNIIFEDAASDQQQAITAMTKLVEQDDVTAVLGPTLSSEAFAADPVAQDDGTPVMGVSNTAAGITDMGEFVFRNSLPESTVIPGTIAQAKDILGLERVGILYGNDDDFTFSGYEAFVDALEANDIEITTEETFAKGDVDFNAQLTNIIATEPDAIVVSALAAEASPIMTQARALGYEGPIIGGNGFNSPALITETGEPAEGLIVGAAWNIASPNPLSTRFTDMYTEAYGGAPDQFAAQAYTGAWLMATAIRCADSADQMAVRDALASISDFETPLGAFSFMEDRNPQHPPVVQIVIDGAFSVLGAE